jgi:hypothetical protein
VEPFRRIGTVSLHGGTDRSRAIPLLALVIMQAAGVAVTLDDTTGPALNYRTTFQLIALGVAMLAVVGLRGAFDAARDRRTSSGRRRISLRRNA